MAVWLTIVFNCLSCLVFIIFVALQRQPLWLLWERWKDKEPRGKVFDLNALALSHAGTNLALDIWMLILPLMQLYKLGLKLKKKMEVIAMFSVGVL